MINQNILMSGSTVRPLLRTYTHVGIPISPKLRDLTPEEMILYSEYNYYKFEEFGPEKFPRTGSFWKKEKFERVHFGCGADTTICLDIAVNYANNPNYYKTAYCSKCMNYFKVGEFGSFVWKDSVIRVGT